MESFGIRSAGHRHMTRVLGVAPAGLLLSGLLTLAAGASAPPVAASGVAAWAQVTVPGQVVAWGRATEGATTVPAGLSDVTVIAAGGEFSLALKENGTVVAWGDNTYGQTNLPLGLSGVTRISAAGEHSLAVKSNGTVVAWGDNSLGESTVPPGLSNVMAVAAGNWHSLALKSNGTVVAWGDDQFGQTDVPPGLSGVVAISGGDGWSMALKSNGTVVAWGVNTDGETNVPAGLSSVVAIDAGDWHALALKTNGTVVAWGDNSSGAAAVPAGLNNVTAISAGDAHSLAMKADGSVVAWGWNHDGQASVPFNVVGAVAVSAGGAHNLAVIVPPDATTYHAIAPARVLDSRPTSGEHTNIGLVNPFVAGTVRVFTVAGAPYVGGGSATAVPMSATAVTGNLTVVNESAPGVVALGPIMTATGSVTTINFAAGDIRANGVTVKLGPTGTLAAVYRSSTAGATMHLIFDVTGYFTPDTSGTTYHLLTPGRVLDSRPTMSGHTNIGLSGKFQNRVVRNFAVTGVTAIGWSSALVPPTARAVTGNITVTNATTAGYVALGPTETTTPKTSTINIVAGANRANGVTVSLSSSGKLGAIWCGKTGSSADVIFDVTGFFTATATGLHYYPITPARYLDTSTGKGLSGKFANKVSRSLTLNGVGAIPAASKGISGNLTIIGPTSDGYAFISPNPVASPTSSTVNTNTAVNCANGFDVGTSGGKVAIIWAGTTGSTTNLQLVVTGYWK